MARPLGLSNGTFRFSDKGKLVKNTASPSVLGVGFMGDGPYNARSPAYRVWYNMLLRVYKPHNSRIALEYKNTSVDKKWYNFQVFASWYDSQINEFDNVPFKWNVDKDLLFPRNRIYSEKTCCVIPQPINTLISYRQQNNRLPLGVKRSGNKYKAVCSSRYLGSYQTIEEARIAYWNNKFEVIKDAAILYYNYLPKSVALRLINFDWADAHAYYGENAILVKE